MKSRGKRLLADLDRDIEDHLQRETEDNIARGMPPTEARLAALRKFGNITLAKEDTRGVWSLTWLEQMLRDVRYAVRTLRLNPVFTAVAVLTLALGIGMNTAVYSVIHAVLFRPLSYPHGERLLWVSNHHPRVGDLTILRLADVLAWQQRAQSLAHVAAVLCEDQALATADEADQENIVSIAGDFWTLTGARPAAGRLFGPNEPDSIVLTHHLFVRRFGGNPAVIGQTMSLDGRPVTVTGVLPANFRPQLPQLSKPDAYIPAPADTPVMDGAIVEPRGGVRIERVRAELEPLRTGPPGFVLVVTPLRERLVGNVRRTLTILLGAVSLVLLIAIVNVANLQLSRAASRRKEIAIRSAVGAGRTRLVRQLLVESLVLSVAGGAVGVILARWMTSLLVRLGPKAVPRLLEISVDRTVLGYTLAISCITGILFGLGPALSMCRSKFGDFLKDGRRASTDRSGRRVRGLLVAGELAMAIVLLTGAGLMFKSIWRINASRPGINPERTLLMDVALSGPRYKARPQQDAFMRELLRRIESIPGVESSGIRIGSSRLVRAPGNDLGGRLFPFDGAHVVFTAASAGYLRATGWRLLKGRWFSDEEPSQDIVVTESVAHRLVGSGDAIGQVIPTSRNVMMGTIVGVVADQKALKLDEEPQPEVFFHPLKFPFMRHAFIAVRTPGDPLRMAPLFRKVVAGIDSTQPLYDLQTMEQRLADSIAPRRFNLFLLAAFAGAAVLLAAFGVYGVMAYSVAQRTHEIGVRVALGAKHADMVGMVIRRGMIVALSGIAVGAAAALGLTRLMGSLLYDVKPNDPATFAVVVGAMAAAALLACWTPARRAALVDPVAALRSE